MHRTIIYSQKHSDRKKILSVPFENNSDIYGLLFVESMFICCGLIRWVSASHTSQCYDKWSGIMGSRRDQHRCGSAVTHSTLFVDVLVYWTGNFTLCLVIYSFPRTSCTYEERLRHWILKEDNFKINYSGHLLLLRCVAGLLIADVSKQHTAFIIKGLEEL